MSAFILHVFRIPEGPGNACAVTLPDGGKVIVDWGSEDDGLLDQLFELVSGAEIRCVVATHAHHDHTRGLAKIFTRAARVGTHVGRFVYPVTADHRRDHPLTLACLQATDLGIPHHDLDVSTLPHGQPPVLVWSEGQSPDYAVQVLAPSDVRTGSSQYKAYGRKRVPGNETSMVLLLRFVGIMAEGRGRIVLPGDAEPATLKFAQSQASRWPELALDNQALVVPHHGSQRNLPNWLLPHLHGAIIVSAPTDAPHHPSRDVLVRTSNRAAAVASGEIFCTSYAGACRREFGPRASGRVRHLVEPGPCFGDLAVRVSATEKVSLEFASAAGQLRRPFGFCGHSSSS